MGCTSTYDHQVNSLKAEPMTSESLLGMQLISKEDPPTDGGAVKDPAVVAERLFKVDSSDGALQRVQDEAQVHGWRGLEGAGDAQTWVAKKDDAQGVEMTLVVSTPDPQTVKVIVAY